MNNLRERTAFLLIDHERVFNQNPSKRSLMDHIKALQDRVDTLEKSNNAPQKPTTECSGTSCTDHGCPIHYADPQPAPEAPVKSLSKLGVDSKILVWDVPEDKHNRHFSHFDEYGYIYTFTDGKTSFTSHITEVSKWLYWDFAE